MTLLCCQCDCMLTLLLVGFSLKHILEKKIGTSLVEANSATSGSNQTTTNEEPNPSTSVTDNEVNTGTHILLDVLLCSITEYFYE